MKEIEVLVLGKVFWGKTPETLSLTHFLVKKGFRARRLPIF